MFRIWSLAHIRTQVPLQTIIPGAGQQPLAALALPERRAAAQTSTQVPFSHVWSGPQHVVGMPHGVPPGQRRQLQTSSTQSYSGPSGAHVGSGDPPTWQIGTMSGRLGIWQAFWPTGQQKPLSLTAQ